jgi:hypothetical protein
MLPHDFDLQSSQIQTLAKRDAIVAFFATLRNDGPTPNGAHFPPGPNDWLAYPVVTAFSGSLVQGIACANCAIYIFKAVGNPAVPGGGGTFLTNVPANGFGRWGATLPACMTRCDVTLTVSNAAYDTSELSQRPQVFVPLIRR